jgi:acyl-CoA reductase-like NAD-dependent aldehyde dehydrogenase
MTVADLFEMLLGRPTLASLIGGDWLVGQGATITVEDPATGQPSHSYADGGEHAAEQAFDAAAAGGRAWRAMTAQARGAVLYRASEAIRARIPDLGRLEAASAGKPVRDAQAEAGKVADMFAYYAGWADKIHGEVVPVPTTHLTLALRQPLDTVVQITPWNAPLFTAGWQLAPALAAGCAAILKPSELTTATSLLLARILHEAGVPAGAVNVVAGLGTTAGARLTGDPRAGKVVFIGAPGTGRRVAAAAAAAGRPALLELGGKSANIVFADADLGRAAHAAQGAVFAAAGQSCTAGSRLLVQRAAYERVVAAVAAGAERLRLGLPLSPETEVGPINNRRQVERVRAMVARAAADGARPLGGTIPETLPAEGFWVPPTVFADVDPAMEIAREEVFGPVLGVIPFDDEAEALAIANGAGFDLAGAVWTSDAHRAMRVASALNAGTVWVNGYRALSVAVPFGGMAGSGFGRSSGHDVLMEYTQSKAVWIETDPASPIPFGYAPEPEQ